MLRWPIGWKRKASTRRRACSTVSTCGTTIPSAPVADNRHPPAKGRSTLEPLSGWLIQYHTDQMTKDMPKTALTRAVGGPDPLRRYVERTRTIYALSYNEVMDSFEATKAAAIDSTPQVAQGATK